jgi:hypothetical protein
VQISRKSDGHRKKIKCKKSNANPLKSIIMDKINELKEIIRIETPLAELGSVSAQQMVIHAQIELDEILETKAKQETFCLQNS